MKTFTDNAGRTWTLALTVDSLRRVKGLAEADLANVLLPRPNQEVPLLVELEEDLLLFADILFALVQPQAQQVEVSREEFDRACNGAVLSEAQRAFRGELEDFFRSLPRREAHLQAMDLLQGMKTKAVDAALRELKQLVPDPRPLETCGGRSGDSPASPASIPAP